MSTTVADLMVLLGGDDRALRKALKESERATERLRRGIQREGRLMNRSFDQVARSARGVARALGPAAIAAITGIFAVATVRKFTSAVEEAIAKLDEIGKTADSLGLSTDALQEWRRVADLSGVSADEFTRANERFLRAVNEARQGVATYKDAFDQLGVSLRTEEGRLKTQEEVLDDVSRALESLEDPAARVGIAMDLFGRNGRKMLNVFDLGARQIAEMRREAHELGLVFDEALIRKSTETKDQLDTLWRVMEADGIRLLGELSDELVQAAKLLSSFVAWVVQGSVELAKFFGLIDRSRVEQLVGERKQLVEALAGASRLPDTIVPGANERRQQFIKESQLRIALIDEEIDHLERLEAERNRVGEPIVVTIVNDDDRTGAGGGASRSEIDRVQEMLDGMERAVEIERLRTRALIDGKDAQKALNAEMETYAQLIELGLVSTATPVQEALEMIRAGTDGTAAALLKANSELAAYREQLQQLGETQRDMLDIEEEIARGIEGDRFQRELDRLQQHHDARLAQLQTARQQEVITENKFLNDRFRLEELHAQRLVQLESRRAAFMAGSAAQTFGAMSDAARTFAGEQSGIFKGLFAVQKAFALAEAIISTEAAITLALASSPPPMNFVMAALAGAKGAAAVATILGTGFERGGYTGHGPRGEVAGVVHRGEFVNDATATARFRPMLEAMNRGIAPMFTMPTFSLPAPPVMQMPQAGGSGAQQVTFKVVNELGPDFGFVRDEREEGTFRMRRIAEDVAEQVVDARAGEAVAADLTRPDSEVSRTLGEFTTAERRRRG